MADKFWVGGAGSWDATTTHWSLTSGGAAGAPVPLATEDVYFDANSGGDTVTVDTVTRVCRILSFRGTSGASDFTGTFAQSGTGSLNISGGLVLSPSTTYTYAGAISFIGTSSFNVTSNGKSLLASNITINGAGLILTCTDNFTTSGVLTLTQGTFRNTDPLGILSIGSFVLTSNTLLRNITVINLYFTGSGALSTIGTTTNFTRAVDYFWVTGSQSSARTLTINNIFYPIGLTYISGSGSGSVTFSNPTSLYVSATINNTGGANISFTTGNYNNILFESGTTTVWNNVASQTLTMAGSVTLAATQGTSILTPAITLTGVFAANQTITSNGKNFVTGLITILDGGNAVAYTFADAFTSTGGLTVTTTNTGVVNVNSNMTISSFTSSGSTARRLNMGSGTWTLTGTGTVWNLTTVTGLTFNSQKSKIIITNTSAVTTTFAGGGLSYYTLEFARGGGGGGITITGSNTFVNFIDNTSTAAHTIIITSATTQTFHRFNVRGSSGALVNIARSSTSSANFVKVGQGVVSNADFLSLGTGQTSCTPANTWYTGANSSGSSTGWIFTNAPSSQSPLGSGGVG